LRGLWQRPASIEMPHPPAQMARAAGQHRS